MWFFGLSAFGGVVNRAVALPPTLVKYDDNKPFWLVRDQRIDLPVQIRVLIKKLPQNLFEITGQSLSVAGLADKLDRLQCDYFESQGASIIPVSLLAGSTSPTVFDRGGWRCFGGGKRIEINGPLALTSSSFIHLGPKHFRNKIELYPLGRELHLVNEVPLEPYLAGLVNKEIRSNYPKEAVKAQVIAARSYALATMAERRKSPHRWYDLKGTEDDQVYQGAHSEDYKSRALVDETKGYVLIHQNDVLKAYYHASSGGHTELPRNVWGRRDDARAQHAYLARHSPWDMMGPAATQWNITLTPHMGNLWPGVGKILDIQVLKRSEGKRVEKIRVKGRNGTVEWSGQEFKRKLGPRWLKSTLFGIRRVPEGFLIEGRGFGHGVGMSQLGAKYMAKEGKSAKEILQFYYPYAGVVKLPTGVPPQSIRLGAR